MNGRKGTTMTDLLVPSLAHNSSSDAEVSSSTAEFLDFVADANLDQQEALVRGICTAQAESGRSVEELAALVGADPELIARAISGEDDLSLTEIRHIAVALNMVVGYRVYPAPRVWEIFERRHVQAMTRDLWTSVLPDSDPVKFSSLLR